jgi:hypothetical protein
MGGEIWQFISPSHYQPKAFASHAFSVAFLIRFDWLPAALCDDVVGADCTWLFSCLNLFLLNWWVRNKLCCGCPRILIFPPIYAAYIFLPQTMMN